MWKWITQSEQSGMSLREFREKWKKIDGSFWVIIAMPGLTEQWIRIPALPRFWKLRADYRKRGKPDGDRAGQSCSAPGMAKNTDYSAQRNGAKIKQLSLRKKQLLM